MLSGKGREVECGVPPLPSDDTKFVSANLVTLEVGGEEQKREVERFRHLMEIVPAKRNRRPFLLGRRDCSRIE